MVSWSDGESAGGYSLGAHEWDEMWEYIPFSVDNMDFCGRDVASGIQCHHGLAAKKRVAFKGANTGRRFLACSMEELDKCDFVHFLDDPWPVTLSKALAELWRKVEVGDRIRAEALYRAVDEKVKAQEEKKEAEDAKMILELKLADSVNEMEMLSKQRVKKLKELLKKKSK